MSKSGNANALRIRLNELDEIWAEAPVQRADRPIAAKVNIGEDAIHGDRS